jgi:hypothetical protein
MNRAKQLWDNLLDEINQSLALWIIPSGNEKGTRERNRYDIQQGLAISLVDQPYKMGPKNPGYATEPK